MYVEKRAPSEGRGFGGEENAKDFERTNEEDKQRL